MENLHIRRISSKCFATFVFYRIEIVQLEYHPKSDKFHTNMVGKEDTLPKPREYITIAPMRENSTRYNKRLSGSNPVYSHLNRII